MTSIGEKAFSECGKLTSIKVDEDNTTFDSRDNCNAIIETASNTVVIGCINTVIPNSVTKIGDYAFYNCKGLTSFIIPNSVTTIGTEAFSNCKDLTSIIISNSVTSIGESCFRWNTALSTVTIGNSVTSIGSGAFSNCSSLTSITIPNGVTSIGSGTFYGCSGLTSISIPNSVTTIGEDAFSSCYGLTSVTIPSSVTSIGNSAFWGCSGLTSIEIPNSVIDIGGYTFQGTAWYNNQPNGMVYAGKVAYKYKGTMPSNTSITLDEGTLGIAGNAFSRCSGLTSVTIPNSVTSIGSSAFSDCSGLTSVNIPNSVTSIGHCAFKGCSGLTSVTIPSSVTSIGWEAFNGCSSLAEIISNIQEPFATGPNCWIGVNKSISLYVPVGAKEKYQSTEGWKEFTNIIEKVPHSIGDVFTAATAEGVEMKFRVKSIAEVEVYSGAIDWSYAGSITIPDRVEGYNVTSIFNRAFSDRSNLTSVTIPNSVTSIGDYAFDYCSGLTSVTIPNSVTNIGDYAFDYCSGLTSINVENDNIKYDSRDNCNAIIETASNTLIQGCKTTVIPNSVTSIGDYAFDYCSGLTSITIPNSVTSIGDYAFAHCYKLTTITIPNSVTSIGDYAFYYCSNLKSIVIPEGVTTIGKCSISWCDRLTSVTIPNSLTMISSGAFSYCWKMNEIISYIQKPFIIDDYCWGVEKTIPLYVPAGTKEKYQSTDGWKDFTNIIEFGGDAIEPTEESQEVDMAAVPDQMDLNGMVVGDTYYALNAENGDGADSENGCVVINSITTDEAVSSIVGKEISDESVKDAFKGVIFMVPAGTGKVSVTGQTVGSSSLMVKVGSQPAQAFQLAERETVQIPYTVTEPTYVYIYAGTSVQGARAQGATTAAAAENSVKVYSYKWEPTQPTGIEAIHNSQFLDEPSGKADRTIENEAGAWYTLDGRKLAGKPAKKGVYIHNGRKVAIK